MQIVCMGTGTHSRMDCCFECSVFASSSVCSMKDSRLYHEELHLVTDIFERPMELLKLSLNLSENKGTSRQVRSGDSASQALRASPPVQTQTPNTNFSVMTTRSGVWCTRIWCLSSPPVTQIQIFGVDLTPIFGADTQSGEFGVERKYLVS
jgi:hypothetical protein